MFAFVIALMTSSCSSKEDFVTFFQGFLAHAPLKRLPKGHGRELSQASAGPPGSTTARIVLDAGPNAFYLYLIAKQTAFGRNKPGQAAAKKGLEQFDKVTVDLRKAVAMAVEKDTDFDDEVRKQAELLTSSQSQSRKRPRK